MGCSELATFIRAVKFGVMGAIGVLIAEDQEIVRIGLKLVLEKEAELSIVAEAFNGELAVQLASDLKPDLVLMDLGMPVMDGIDATKAIKASIPNTKVIILTTHDSESDVFAALAAGADGYCLKSAGKDQLIAAISAVAKGGQWMDPAIAGSIVKGLMNAPPAQDPVVKKADAAQPYKFPLSNREMEVLQLLVEGLSNQEMADRLIVSVETVKTHMRHVMEKLQVADRTQAAVKALKSKLVSMN